MNKSKRSSLKRVVLAAAVLLGCAAAAPSFARSHVSVGIGINLPGVSVGYSDGYRGYYHHPYYGGYGYAAPVYYRPAPRVVYYDEPVVVERPVYVRRVYEERGYYSDGYRTRHYRDDYDGD